MGTGYLKMSLTTGSGALPVAGAAVTVTDDAGSVLYRLTTNDDGLTDAVKLNAPDASNSLDPNYVGVYYSTYNVKAEAGGFESILVRGVQVYESLTSILPINMIPMEEDMQKPILIEIDVPPPAIVSQAHRHDVPPEMSGMRVLDEVVIPTKIRVQLGPPTATANVVSVTFPDYIKNVCSSEIFPTWPETAIEANIYCQISLALNRIFTEWYPSQGRDFDITNHTAWDQYFIYGRNIYENISLIVDRIFNRYVRREGHKEPYYTEYCDGRQVQCPGLWQWGTVDLANRGFTPIQMLRYYYPNDVQIVETNNIQSVPVSYPGYPLSEGMSGTPVKRIQDQLNRIRVNFPLIPRVNNPVGIFGPDTKNSVSAFQREFSLTADGVVGKTTWNKISFIYVAVKKLAELTGEGIIIGVTRTPPSVTLRLGDRGRNVGILQHVLNYIAEYKPGVPSILMTYSFDNDTRAAVLAFQSLFGLPPDGVVGPTTWTKLYNSYWGIRDYAAGPEVPEPPPFPGTALRLGSSGPAVFQIQTCLNRIATFHPEITRVVVDSSFGPATQTAVTQFQRIHSLTQDGVVGPVTWDRIMEECVTSGPIEPPTPPPNPIPPFPGTLRVGSRGESVRQVQQCLNRVGNSFPSIPRLSEDGIFGNITQGAVIEFQRLFGLVADGIVGPITWGSLMEACASAGGGTTPPPARPPFPGFLISLGAQGAFVSQIQQCLNTVAAVHTSIPRVTVDGVFGAGTRASVIAFQRVAALVPDGIVGDADIIRPTQ